MVGSDPSGGPPQPARPGGAEGRAQDARSPLLDLALFALRAARTREELLEEAARITAAALGGDLSKVLERLPPGAEDFLVTAGAGWAPGDAVVGTLRVPGGADASPSGRAEAAGTVQASSSEADAEDPTTRVPDALVRAGVRSGLDAPIPRAGEAGARGHGVLQADSRRGAAFSRSDAALLRRIAEVLGATLDAEDRRRAALEAATAVQALLAAEAEHRIANSLQAVAGSLALQARLADDDPRVAAALRVAAARVAAAGAVHRHLHRAAAAGQGQDGGGSVDAAALLRALCADLSALLSSPDGTEGRHLACAAEPFPWPAVRAGALATIAVELAINAAKHAPTGTIMLRLSATAGGDALLAAEDEGSGFPADLDLGQADGLGMRLIRALAGPGNDRLTIDRAAPGGRIAVRVAAAG